MFTMNYRCSKFSLRGLYSLRVDSIVDYTGGRPIGIK